MQQPSLDSLKQITYEIRLTSQVLRKKFAEMHRKVIPVQKPQPKVVDK
jgi:hypothetical protein